MTNTVERLCEIQESIEELLREARTLVEPTRTWPRARYWHSAIKTALDKNHEYLGGCMFTLEDTIHELDNDPEYDT